MAEKFQAYADALSAALPEGCGFNTEVVAEVWAGIANAHRDYFRYGDILNSIVETNVSIYGAIEKPTGLWLGELIHFYDEMVIQKSC